MFEPFWYDKLKQQYPNIDFDGMQAYQPDTPPGGTASPWPWQDGGPYQGEEPSEENLEPEEDEVPQPDPNMPLPDRKPPPLSGGAMDTQGLWGAPPGGGMMNLPQGGTPSAPSPPVMFDKNGKPMFIPPPPVDESKPSWYGRPQMTSLDPNSMTASIDPKMDLGLLGKGNMGTDASVGLLGGAGGDTFGGGPSMMRRPPEPDLSSGGLTLGKKPGLDETSPLTVGSPGGGAPDAWQSSVDNSLLGGGSSDSLGGGNEDILGGGPRDDGENPGFFSRLFGGAGSDRLGRMGTGISGMGAALLALSTGEGDKAANALNDSNKVLLADKAQTAEEKYRQQALALREREMGKEDITKEEKILNAMGLRRGDKGFKEGMERLAFSTGSDATGTKLADDMGLVPGSQERKDFLMKYALKAQSQVIIDQKGESATTVELGKLTAKKIDEADTSIAQSHENMNTLRLMEKFNKNPKVAQGPIADKISWLKQAGEQLGIPVEGQDEEQMWTALTSRMALSARSTAQGGGMPGAMSDADRDFLVKMMPGIKNTPEGNRLMIKVMQRMEQFKIGYNTEMQNYLLDNGARGMPQHMSKWAKENSFFEDLKDDPDLVTASGGGGPRRWDE